MTASPPAPLRRRRWIWRALAGLGALLVLVVVVVVVVVGNLDRPWIKGRLQSLAKSSAGIEVEYSQTRVGHRGARIDGLVVRSAGAELLRAGSIELDWSLSGRRIREARLREVVVTLLVPDDAKAPPQTGPPAPQPEPPSQVAARLLGNAPPIDRLSVDGLTLVVVRPRESLELRGLSLHVETRPWHIVLGSAEAPLELDLARTLDGAVTGEAKARVWLSLKASASGVDALLDARLVKQTLAPAAGLVHQLIHLEATARFDVKAGAIEVAVAHGSAADGAASFEAQVKLQDGGAPIIRHAQGDLDLDRLLALVPADWTRLTLQRGQLHYRVEQLLLSAVPRLGEHGVVEVDGEVAGLALPNAKIGAARVRLSAHPEKQAWSGQAELHFGTVSLPGLEARDGRVELRAQEIEVDPADATAIRGKLQLSGQAASVELRKPHLLAEGVKWSAHSHLIGREPYALELDLPIERLRQFAAGGGVLVDSPAHLSLTASELFLGAFREADVRGKLHLGAELGALHATLELKKEIGALDFTATADATSLAAARALLGARLPGEVPWERMSLSLRSTGRVEHLAAPEIRHVTELHLGRPGFHDRKTALAADELSLILRSNGTLGRQSGDADLKLRKLMVGDTAVGDSHLTLSMALDTAAPSLKLKLTADGQAGPSGALSASVAFDRARRVVSYDLDGKLAKLALLAPLIAGSGVDPTQLDLALTAKGTLAGVVRQIAADGTLKLEPRPLATFAPDAKIQIVAHKVIWSQRDRELDVPALEWQLELHSAGERRTVHSELAIGALELDAGEHELDLSGVKQIGDAALTGDLARGELEIKQQLTVRALSQDLAPNYPAGDLALNFEALRDRDGLLRVTKLELDNRAGGTTLSLRGALDIVDERRRVALRGDLSQDLSKLWKDPHGFTGSGTAALSLRLSSTNLKVFRTLASIKVSGVSLQLPRAGVSLQSVEGEIPLGADVTIGAHGVTMLRDADVNPYSELRFTDQHPLLSQRSYLSIARVTTPVVSIAPLAGNLKIQQNIISLSQLEMGIRGGRVTGQCVLDYDGGDSTVQAHIRASGVQSSHGEPFDGNAAMVFSARDRSLDGRADILRIGRRHLYDLLDVQDPHRADASINRIRRGLSLGYPDRVRLSFDRGFASIKVTFGGLARLISIDEIRGIPIGPLIDKFLAKLNTNEDEE